MEKIKIVRDTSATARGLCEIIPSFIDSITEYYRKVYGEFDVKDVEIEIEEASSGISSTTVIAVPKGWDEKKVEDFVNNIIDLIDEWIAHAIPLK